MTEQKRFTVRQAIDKGMLSCRRSEGSSPVENLLRDVAFVLHAAAAVRRAIEAEQAACVVVS